MKKRYYVLLMMLVSCLWISCTKMSVHAVNATNTEQSDTLLGDFMRDNNLPSILIVKDCELNLAYSALNDDGAGATASGDQTYMLENYGIKAEVYCYENAQITTSSVKGASKYKQSEFYLYLDITFTGKENLGSDDSLLITLPAGIRVSDDAEVKGRWAKPDGEKDWTIEADFTVSKDKLMGKSICIPLNQIIPGKYGNRLLLAIHGLPADEEVNGFQGMHVTWQHRTSVSNNMTDDVVVKLPENLKNWKKVAALAAVLILDVIVAAIVYFELKQRPKKEDISLTVELSEEQSNALRDELQSNLKLKNEEIEYLKSIGYFGSSKNEK